MIAIPPGLANPVPSATNYLRWAMMFKVCTAVLNQSPRKLQANAMLILNPSGVGLYPAMRFLVRGLLDNYNSSARKAVPFDRDVEHAINTSFARITTVHRQELEGWDRRMDDGRIAEAVMWDRGFAMQG